jgi:cation diffusion facilitator CzcD-associated flavoprotein CzcO
MFTLGYSFKPWQGEEAIADGDSILDYIEEAAREYGVRERIRFGHRVLGAEWSSTEARWTVRAEHEGETVELTCDFLYGCTGYYRYDEGYTPEFSDSERFGGRIVHPQHWPEDLDYAGKRVVVIGSGATAVTLVPALAEEAAQVTMLQRSPTYVVSVPAGDGLAELLRRWLPEKAVYSVVRWKHVLRMMLSYRLARRAPKLVRKVLRKQVEAQLPAGFDVDTHFEPRYDPWDQRLCAVPGGDLFKALSDGSAAVVTDEVESFTENGLRLASGRELEADIAITATGLNMLFLGGLELVVDGKPVDPSQTVIYKGMMLSGVPNLALALGYTNASWSLKCDLVGEYICRLLRHMDANGHRIATPRAPSPLLPTEPAIDLEAGYVTRSLHLLPRQGSSQPWRLHQNYARDIGLLRRGPVDDEIEFSAGGQTPPNHDRGDRRHPHAEGDSAAARPLPGVAGRG